MRQDRVQAVVERALALVDSTEPESAKVQRLWWVAGDDRQLLEAAMQAAMTNRADLVQRGAAIALLHSTLEQPPVPR